MKKLLSILLTVTMFVCIFTACNATQPVISDDLGTVTTTLEEETDVTDNAEEDEPETGKTTTGKTKPTRKTTTKRTTAPPTTTALITTTPTTARPTVATVKKNYATDRKLKVACVGDSITAGGYWENNLKGELSSANYEVKGFGKSGATALFNGVDYIDANTNGPKAYVDQDVYKKSLSYGADIVVIMLGTNDSKTVNWPYYGHEFCDNYIEIIRSYQNSDSKPMVFVALPPTAYKKASAYQGISDAVITEDIIPELYIAAAVTGAIVIDTHTATQGDETLVKDGVHPSAKGQTVLCETIAAAIITDTNRE